MIRVAKLVWLSICNYIAANKTPPHTSNFNQLRSGLPLLNTNGSDLLGITPKRPKRIARRTPREPQDRSQRALRGFQVDLQEEPQESSKRLPGRPPRGFQFEPQEASKTTSKSTSLGPRTLHTCSRKEHNSKTFPDNEREGR